MEDKMVFCPTETDNPLRKIQLYQLEMLKELDSVCRKNGLRYCLAYGTLLGAVRHKGFIPWDDDLDVRMPYKDMKKLLKFWDSERLSVQCPQTDIEMPFQYYKIRLNDSYMHDDIDDTLDVNHGIWIDVFPYINAAKSEQCRKVQFYFLQCFQSYRCRYLKRSKSGLKGSINRMLCSLPKTIQIVIDNILLGNVIVLGRKKSDMFCHLGNGNFKQSFFKKDFCKKYTEITFENMKVFVPENYDEVLTFSYGDYMTPKKYSHLSDYSGVVFPND